MAKYLDKAGLKKALTGVKTYVDGVVGYLSDLNSNYTDDARNNVVAALNAVMNAVQSIDLTPLIVSVDTKGTANDGSLKTYQVKQGGSVVGEIDIPYELFVDGGWIITLGAGGLDPMVNETDTVNYGISHGAQGDKFLKLRIANQQEFLYIAVSDLVDVYTADNASGADVLISISNTNGISATLSYEAMMKLDQAHSHSNKSELDKIEDGDKAKWDLNTSDSAIPVLKTDAADGEESVESILEDLGYITASSNNEGTEGE